MRCAAVLIKLPRISFLPYLLSHMKACSKRQSYPRIDMHETIVAERFAEPHPVKRTVKKYKVFRPAAIRCWPLFI